MTRGTYKPGPTERANLILDAYDVPRQDAGRKLSLGERIERLGRSVPALLTVREVCDRLGVASSNLNGLRGLPEPVAVLNPEAGRPSDRVRVWLAGDIDSFAAERARRNGGRA